MTMFAKVRNRHERTSSNAIPPPISAAHANASTISAPTANANANANAIPPPLVSPLQMTFDFELPSSTSILSAVDSVPRSPSLFRPSAESGFGRPKTSDGLGIPASRKSVVGLTPPLLPPIPRIASRDGSTGSGSSQEADAFTKARARDESDNVSTSSRTSKKGIKLKSMKSFEHPLDLLPTMPPDSGSGAKRSTDSRPSTSSGNTPKMESSLFPKKDSPLLPQIDSGPSMSRAWLDSRDRGYAPPQTRPVSSMQQAQSSPDMLSMRSPSMHSTYSARSPLASIPVAPPVPDTPASPKPRPVSVASLRAPKISGARLSPNASASDLREQLVMDELKREKSRGTISPPQPSPSLPPTNYSGSTARPSTQSSTPTVAVLPTSPSQHSVIGTPYQETSASFPLPQHVATRPKTAGATATVAGVSVPTHHTHGPKPESTKVDKRKTRLLNPMNLLVRRRSGQEDAAIYQDRSSQAQAFARQKSVAALGGVSNIPEDFDPRIRGKVVHDFSAPRAPRRNFSYNDAEMYSSDSQFQSSSSAPFIPALIEEGIPFEQTMTAHTKQASESSTSRKSTHSPMFREHLSEAPDAQKRVSSLNAERLENREFVQRASHQSHISTFSQESAVLPPFARRSQQFSLDPAQAAFFNDDESKRSSDHSSGKSDERDSGVSKFSEVSPVTARSSGAHARVVDVRDSLSPISPASPDKTMAAVAARPPTTINMNVQDVPKSPEPRARSQSELTARPYSVNLGQAAATVEPIEEHPQPHFDQPASSKLLASHRDSTMAPEAVHQPNRDSGQAPEFLSPSQVPGMMRIPIPERGSSRWTPEMSTPELTPEIREVQTAMAFRAPQSPIKLVEKRASAAGHSQRSTGGPKHHVSNASRFSFQFEKESAVEEQKLMDKHERVTRDMTGMHVRGPSPDDEEDYFDEDAMDDMDEMEVQQHQPLPIAAVPALAAKQTAPSLTHLQQARVQLQQHDESGEDSGSVYDDEDEEDEVPDLREPTYAEHPDFRLHSALAFSRAASQQSWRGPFEQAVRDGKIGNTGRSRGASDASELTVNTNLPPAPMPMPVDNGINAAFLQDDFSQSESVPGMQVGGARPRSGFYMQPHAAGYSPAAGNSPQTERPPLPHRDSGNSERNRIASGLSFGSNGDAAAATQHQSMPSSSTAASTSSQSGGKRVTSQSTMGDSRSSGARTTSSGLGLSGFSDFRFNDSPSPNNGSRPPSFEPSQRANAKRTTGDSETIPRTADWNDIKKHASMGTPPSQRTTQTMSTYFSSPDSAQSAAYKGTVGKHVRDRNTTMNQNLQYADSDSGDDGGDDMYFDDGNFDEQDLKRPQFSSLNVDEAAFDHDGYLNGNARALRAVNHQRDTSALTMASLGGDGPYPSFAQPITAVKARQRQSQMLLEDLPLQAPVDPKWIPQRNPSEDAKRLGLSSKVPPLPAPPGSKEAHAQMQNSLQAYHAALADAANKAAAEGRFLRTLSVTTTRTLSAYSRTNGDDDKSQYSRDDRSHYSRDEDEDERGIASESLNRNTSQQTSGSKQGRGISYTPPKMSDFDFGFGIQPLGNKVSITDDFEIMDDEADDIVAAANAEALASDDEGFYGQEFGFYAKARNGSGEDVSAVNGGFFGQDGDDGLTRNKSGKEPNLTPITERSEFSTRNSFIGLPHGVPFAPSSAGPFGGSTGSPALARMPLSPLAGNEVTSFDQLRKLRANAFGGSNGSLRSEGKGTAPGPAGPYVLAAQSPSLSARSSAAAQGYFGPMGGAPMTFGYSTDSSGSSNPSSAHAPLQSLHGSPQRLHFDSPQSATTTGAHMPFTNGTDMESTPRPNKHAVESPTTTAKKVSASNHARKASGADSVTYVQERDPETRQPKWVLERRRTSEQGQLELIGREVVQGGWI